MKKEKKFFTVYQIKNLVNGKIYVGAHATNRLNDNYWGSSKYLREDIRKLGKENFEKRILYIFDNVEDMKSKEAEIVNREWCYSVDTYNRMVGGLESFSTIDMVTVKDSEGNTMKVYCDDPRYLSGELVSNMTGKMYGKDKNGNVIQVDKDDIRFKTGELTYTSKGRIVVKDEDGNTFQTTKNDPRYLSGELVGITKGLPGVKSFQGKSHSEETKLKMRKPKNMGEKNSQFGTCWVTNGEENKKIKKEELSLWEEKGFHRGRKV